MTFSYANPKTPRDYRCSLCKARGVKMWREYQTFSPSLFCGACALAKQKMSGPIDERGYIVDDGHKTDAIGWLVPAVPTPSNDGYWGYSAVPDAGVEWWRALPTEAR